LLLFWLSSPQVICFTRITTVAQGNSRFPPGMTERKAKAKQFNEGCRLTGSPLSLSGFFVDNE